MSNAYKSFLLFSLVLALVISCNPQRKRIPAEDENVAVEKRILTEDGAIARAEEFIKDNGYTDLPPTEDKSKLVPESMEYGLEYRRNTLESKAYGIIPGGRGGDGWYVVFRYNRNNAEYQRLTPNFEQGFKKYGRAVVMDRYGESLKVEHQAIGFGSRNLKRIVR